MKKTKMEKGITLIALIITIVILLILAVVTIGAIRNSRIITHSQNASNDYTVAQEKEKIQLALSEWQIQKNAPRNTQTFKNVIETELNGNATIFGEEEGPLTTVMNNTQNRYKLLKDGTITEIAKLTGTPLEKYIFGEDLLGRNFNEIYSGGNFINEASTISNASTTMKKFSNYAEISYDYENYAEYNYIKYDNKTYKFLIVNSDWTCADYGIIEIELVGEKIGKIVNYDEKLWTILYDDETRGLQMICNESYKYGRDFNSNFSLDYYTNNYKTNYWTELDKTSEEFKLADLDKNGEIDSEIEKSIYIYNNAIEILNTACEEVVPQNENIIDIRCIGSNPENKKVENTERYASELLESLPINNSEIKTGVLNGIMKKTSLDNMLDYDRLIALEWCKGYGWIYAMRCVDVYNSEGEIEICFNIYDTSGTGKLELYSQYVFIDESEIETDFTRTSKLCPVVKLKSDVQFSGTGTETDPYTFAE